MSSPHLFDWRDGLADELPNGKVRAEADMEMIWARV